MILWIHQILTLMLFSDDSKRKTLLVVVELVCHLGVVVVLLIRCPNKVGGEVSGF